MNTNYRFASVLRLIEQGLALRKQFLTITPERVNALCTVADYMEQVAPQMMREFYEFQFQLPETARFFEQYAAQNHLSLSQLRTRLENAQLEYFLQIFREARAGGRFGLDFMEKRLVIGHLHNKINLPVKWYLGSYALYVELLKKYLLQSSEIDYEVACEAMAAILTVFLYDIQAVIDSFIVMLLSDLCVDTQRSEVASAMNEITAHFNEIRAAFKQSISDRAGRAGRTMGSAAQRGGSRAERDPAIFPRERPHGAIHGRGIAEPSPPPSKRGTARVLCLAFSTAQAAPAPTHHQAGA
jgi:hypothetical protein